jgi:hypothetical protein
MIVALYILGAACTSFCLWVIFEVTREDHMKPNWLHVWLFVIFWPIALVAVAGYATIDYAMRRN